MQITQSPNRYHSRQSTAGSKNQQWSSQTSYKKQRQNHQLYNAINVPSFNIDIEDYDYDYDQTQRQLETLNTFNYYNVEVWKCDQNAIRWGLWAEKQLSQNVDQSMNFVSTVKEKELSNKPRSAFKLFKLDHIVAIKSENPEFGFKERLVKLKEMWKLLPRKEKFDYVTRSRNLKEQQKIQSE